MYDIREIDYTIGPPAKYAQRSTIQHWYRIGRVILGNFATWSCALQVKVSNQSNSMIILYM